MVVHFLRQAVSTFSPASFKHFATTGSFHPLPKTMHSHSTTLLWLVSSFWHIQFPIIDSTVIIYVTYSTCLEMLPFFCGRVAANLKRIFSSVQMPQDYTVG
jgi:hypothetical protein